MPYFMHAVYYSGNYRAFTPKPRLWANYSPFTPLTTDSHSFVYKTTKSVLSSYGKGIDLTWQHSSFCIRAQATEVLHPHPSHIDESLYQTPSTLPNPASLRMHAFSIWRLLRCGLDKVEQ